jgi:hypothetical protein
MIQVKDAEVYRELLVAKYHPKLVELELWIVERYSGIVITSGYRDGDNGVHGTDPCRGKDIRSYGLKRKNNGSMIDAGIVCTEINAAWRYDPKRPEKVCAKMHNVGYGMHIHLQIHPNTEMK